MKLCYFRRHGHLVFKPAHVLYDVHVVDCITGGVHEKHSEGKLFHILLAASTLSQVKIAT